MDKHHVRIGYIGGGSRNWALNLMTDLALEPALEGELMLYDIDMAAARHNEALAGTLFGRPDALGRFTAKALPTAREALSGADIVVISIEPGPMQARFADLVVPARHGIVQTVGDTTGPGGLLRALRAVPVMEDYARLIMDACPGAWVINYTNPMTLSVAALHRAAPGIKAHGCCHEVFGTQERIAELLGAAEGSTPPRREIELDIAGVNHFTLATGVRWKGRDLMPLVRDYAASMDSRADRSALGLERRSREAWFDCDGAIALDMLDRLGALGAAGDRHLAEFVPWYLVDEATILSYGVPPTPYEWRLRTWSGPRPSPAEAAARPLEPSGEEGVAQIKALLGLGPLVTNLNLPNRGQWSQAPEGAVVETMARLSEGSIEALPAASLPPAAAELERRIMAEQALVLEAAETRNFDLALQALLLDPLVYLSTSRAESLLKDMLAAASPWLPDWRIK